MPYEKSKDPFSYVKAEDYFNRLDSDEPEFQRVESVQLHPGQFDESGQVVHPACHHGRAFETNGNKILLIDFIRPTAFRLRFNPEKTYEELQNFWDNNTCNLVSTKMKDLIELLDDFENKKWAVDHWPDDEKRNWIVLESKLDGAKPGEYCMRIYVRKKKFKIIAVQPLPRRRTHDDDYLDEFAALGGRSATNSNFEESAVENQAIPSDVKIVWQTRGNGILYDKQSTVVEVHKPSMARYLGFGEQGGRQLLKTKVVLDYFNYDNMTYSQVYGQGPLDSREPLYHSEPFWMEIRQHPAHWLKVASFVDNLSQVCLDIGTRNINTLRVACRFNSMRLFVFADESISKVINAYTLVVGRPQLKPRYVLGYHQGCYGYDTATKVETVVDQYRENGFPLDAMHIDVDIQRDYKTFTVDETRFPKPKDFFNRLKDELGVKCSTNITPFINGDEDDTYPTLNQGIENGHFIKDKRYKDDGPQNAHEDRYMLYRGGKPIYINPNELDQELKDRYEPQDEVQLSTVWDRAIKDENVLFRGGVWYGGTQGRPGYYPDLNRKAVRDWWGQQYKSLIDDGLEFVWQDMTSPCIADGYGDMKGFPFRLLLTGNTVRGYEPEDGLLFPAIQIWSLYAYNLHEATFKGWNKIRPEKRNFIIGRGGFAGLHRFAGLWTGDNSSDWDFLRVSVAQVLSLGLSGITVSGADVGGFEPGRDGGQWACPELLMRWYCAYSLLPWFRNHYNAKEGKKLFQEPFRYHEGKDSAHGNEKWLYDQVLPVCQYYVRLRYTFLQLLYDQMFDNLWTGLPIARSLVISHPNDSSLVGENSDFLDDEYTVGDDLLVAPVLHPQGNNPDGAIRKVYLPSPLAWWQCNLRAEGALSAVRLKKEHEFTGGSLIDYDTHLNRSGLDISSSTPMFIRFGSIIPQVEPSLYAEDWAQQGPISIHIFPGHKKTSRSYNMYLDDGISAASAPKISTIQESLFPGSIGIKEEESKWSSIRDDGAFSSQKAEDEYWKVMITQDTEHMGDKPNEASCIRRHITVQTTYIDGIKFNPAETLGPNYEYCRLIIWGEPKRSQAFHDANIESNDDGSPNLAGKSPCYCAEKNAWFVWVNIERARGTTYSLIISYSSKPS